MKALKSLKATSTGKHNSIRHDRELKLVSILLIMAQQKRESSVEDKYQWMVSALFDKCSDYEYMVHICVSPWYSHMTSINPIHQKKLRPLFALLSNSSNFHCSPCTHTWYFYKLIFIIHNYNNYSLTNCNHLLCNKLHQTLLANTSLALQYWNNLLPVQLMQELGYTYLYHLYTNCDFSPNPL